MSATVSPTQTDVFTAVRSVLGTFGLIPSDPAQPVAIIRGQVNRVPEPAGPDFVVLWPVTRARLSTNRDIYSDTICTGTIVGNTLAVVSVEAGPMLAGQTIYGAGVSDGCQIVRQLTGPPGDAGTYQTTPTADVPSVTALYTGQIGAVIATEITIQADVHGPSSADNATRIATLWRDYFGVVAFDALGFPGGPLYTTDPRQASFDNGEQQVEERWMVDLCLQANVGVATTMQFADTLKIATSPVETLPA